MADFSVFKIAAMQRQRAEAAARADAAKAAEARRAEFARLTAADMAPENDPELIAALRAAADPATSRFAHLDRPMMQYEAETGISNVLAAIRQSGIDQPPTGVAGFVLAAAEKGRVTDTIAPPPPDIDSKDPATACAAFVLDAFRRGHEKQKR